MTLQAEAGHLIPIHLAACRIFGLAKVPTLFLAKSVGFPDDKSLEFIQICDILQGAGTIEMTSTTARLSEQGIQAMSTRVTKPSTRNGARALLQQLVQTTGSDVFPTNCIIDLLYDGQAHTLPEIRSVCDDATADAVMEKLDLLELLVRTGDTVRLAKAAFPLGRPV